MANDFNQIRKTNAKLGQKNITTYGKTYAVQYGLDGFSAVNNVVAPMPTDIKEYLEGNTDITTYACASNIDKLCEYALASFPNIEDLYLFKTSSIVVLDDDLSYLLDLNKIYVPSDLLSAYISAYPTLSSKFDTIVEDYTLTIPYVGISTLTSEYVDSVIAMLSSAEKNAITKVVIPTDFSEDSANYIAWEYDFSELTNLNNNIWYGNTQYDFSEYTIQGSGELTIAIVDSELAKISADKYTTIEKIIVPLSFTSYASGSITELQAFMNTNSIYKLVTTYEAGAMIIDFQDQKWIDILAQMTLIEKTLDEALVYARTLSSVPSSNQNLIILPPLPEYYSSRPQQFLANSTNLVCIYDLRFTDDTGSDFRQFLNGCSNLIYLKVKFPTGVGMYQSFVNVSNIKYIDADFTNTTNAGSYLYALYFLNISSLTEAIYKNWVLSNFSIDDTSISTRENLLKLINSLGTPTETKILTMGATKLALLTADDIAIATVKNWTLQ